jgi:hypothetical protein
LIAETDKLAQTGCSFLFVTFSSVIKGIMFNLETAVERSRVKPSSGGLARRENASGCPLGKDE